jgi:hypothetical protein
MKEMEEDMDKETKRYEDLQDIIAERDTRLKIELEKIEGLKDHISTLK